MQEKKWKMLHQLNKYVNVLMTMLIKNSSVKSGKPYF